jgi:hypothetical protein
MRLKRVIVAVWLLGALAGVNDAAEDMGSASLIGESDRLQIESKHWDFGLQFGYAMAIGDKSTSITADNSVFLYSDPDTPGEDEFAENGLPSPDFAGQTVISGDRKDSYWVGAHLYYHLTSWIGLGTEASYIVEDKIAINASGPFGESIYDTQYKTHSFQDVLSVRLGGWMGGIRPYVMAGVGPYVYTEGVTTDLTDPDDPNHTPLDAAGQTHVYASVLYGGGLDFKVLEEGSVGLGLQFQQAYMPGKDLMYVIPSARFAYHF